MSNKTIKIPETIEKATRALNAIEALLTAKQWTRAAIVYAFTHDCPGGGCEACGGVGEITDPPSYSVVKFAALGINGLRSDQTVRNYRKAWQAAIDAGKACSVEPGEEIDLPEMDWPPTGHSHGDADKIKSDAPASSKAEVVRKHLADPEVAREVFSDPEVSQAAADIIPLFPTTSSENRFEGGYERLREEREERIRSNPSSSYFNTGVGINRAIREIAKATDMARAATHDEDFRAKLKEKLEKLQSSVELLSLAIEGSVNVDWDSELSRLLEDDESA